MTEQLKNTLLAVVRRSQTNDMMVRQLAVLTCLADGPRTVRDLAAETTLPKPSISRAGDKLEALGFALRKDDDADRRSVLLTITPAGKRFLATIDKP
jgi:DNA-binding MarR family transcriptional regulator